MFRIVFWDVLPCKNIVDRRFIIPDDGGSMHLWNVGRQLFYTAVHPEDNSELHTRRRENLKSHNSFRSALKG
jgi:hypothetical protein